MYYLDVGRPEPGNENGARPVVRPDEPLGEPLSEQELPVNDSTTHAKPVRIPALATIAAKLEAMVDAARPFGSAEDVRDVRLALASLMLACQSTLDDLAAIGGRATLADMAAALGAPPIAGGSPVACDCEECKPWDGDCDYDAPGDDYFDRMTAPDDYAADAEDWPAWTDNFHINPTPDFTGALPLSVLASTAPDELADEYDAWLDGLAESTAWTEADQIVAHGCC